MVVHPGMAGQVTADFPGLRSVGGELVRMEHDGLAEAMEWARRILASDPQVDAVTIRQSVQEYDGQTWKAGRHVQTVTRPPAEAAAGSGPRSTCQPRRSQRRPGRPARPRPGTPHRRKAPDRAITPPGRPQDPPQVMASSFAIPTRKGLVWYHGGRASAAQLAGEDSSGESGVWIARPTVSRTSRV